jgi:hypothetical protein
MKIVDSLCDGAGEFVGFAVAVLGAGFWIKMQPDKLSL